MFNSFNLTQKIIMLFFGLCLILNIYYEYDINDQKVIVNPTPWKSFPNEQDNQWANAVFFELRTYMTEVKPFHKNNFFGLTYDVFCEVRYKAEYHNQLSDKIDLYYTQQSLLEAQSIQNAKHIKSDYENISFSENAFGENLHFYNSKNDDEYYKSNSGLNIQFHTTYFTPKYIKFNIDNNIAVWVKTNPLLVFNSDIVSISLFGLGFVLLLALAVSGGFESFLFLIVLLFYFSFSDYFIWFYFFFLFSLSIFFKIKMRTVTVKWLDLPFVYWKILLLVFVSLVLYIHRWENPFSWSELFFESLVTLIYLFLIWLMFYVSSTSIYSLYIYIFCKEKDIEQLKFINFTSNMDSGNTGKRIPYFSATIELKGKTIQNVLMNFTLYSKVKNNKVINLTKYKTDNKGNYIFY